MKYHKGAHVWHIERPDGTASECIMGLLMRENAGPKWFIESSVPPRGHLCLKCLDMIKLRQENPEKYEQLSTHRYHLVHHTHTWFYCGEHKIINRNAPIDTCEECKKAIRRGMAVDGQDPNYYKKAKRAINERIITRRQQERSTCTCHTDENGCLIICESCFEGSFRARPS